ncbi:hypothetical protein [Acidovorax sp. K2F]|uniref:hypothetical protein n=1 Tax=Acidovorax sp. K2F TaxID=2978125 RepID=UPI0021B0C09A|nr:hypothetical protein [Acidovorax sp. K2F]MCT6721645.1 hypothetical protein [Acidovorax sp. K2F]
MAYQSPLARRMGRCNRPAPGKFTRDTSQETFRSPATHASTSRLDSIVRTRSPLGSTFSLSAERCELWMTWPVASAVVGVVCEVMVRIFVPPLSPVHVQISEIRT